MIYKLEERVLFDSALPVDVAEAEVVEDAVDVQETGADADTVEESTAVDESSELSNLIESITGSESDESVVNELYIIDSSVTGYEQVVDNLPDGADVVLISPYEHGIGSISSFLRECSDLSAIHIVGHGSAGEIQLGEDLLTLETLDSFSDDFKTWNNSLADGADILFYGCNVAESAEGKALVSEISVLTAADVAASDDLVGHAGDGEFEFQVGEIEADILDLTWMKYNLAESIEVTTTEDTVSATDYIDGSGNYQATGYDSNDADHTEAISLREAISTATSGDSIVFSDSLGEATITLNSTLTVDKNLTIDGGSDITIDGGWVDGDSDGDGVVDSATNDRWDANEGGVRIFNISDSDVSLKNMVLQHAANYNYGAVYFVASGKTLDIDNLTISNCSSSNYGPAVYIGDGSVNINNSTFDQNYGGAGGTVTLRGTGTSQISNSTFSDNTLVQWGGGIMLWSDNVSLTVENSTFTGNYAKGIISQYSSGAGLIVDHCTFAFNDNKSRGAIYAAGNVDVSNSIFLEKCSEEGGMINDLGHNIFLDSVSAIFDHSSSINVGDGLGVLSGTTSSALGDFGGSTKTLALAYESIAIDAASDAIGTDQRGKIVHGATRDIGAFESRYGASSSIVTTANDNIDYEDGVTSLREAIIFASDGDTITFSDGLGTVSIILNETLEVGKSITIDGGHDVTIDGGDTGLGDGVQIFKFISGDSFLKNMTIQNAYGASGAAIHSAIGDGETLTIDGVTLQANTTTGDGSAFYAENGNVNIVNSSIINNNASKNYRAAVWLNGAEDVYVYNTTFYGNKSLESVNGVSRALRIQNVDSITIDHSTLSSVKRSIYVDKVNDDGGFVLTNSIVTQEVFFYKDDPNKENDSDAVVNEVINNNVLVMLSETSNNVPIPENIAINAQRVLDENVLISESAMNAIFATGTPTDNGGNTPTLALASGSAAIDAASDSTGTDQRGSQAIGAKRDIGAFEYRLAPGITVTGENAGEVSVAENLTAVTTVSSSDGSSLDLAAASAGNNNGDFVIENGVLKLKSAGDYESGTTSYTVDLVAIDAIDSTVQTTKQITVSITDVNEAPSSIAIVKDTGQAAVVSDLDENTTDRTLIGVISITDDALGTESLSLSGDDKDLFEIENGKLYLKADQNLNYEDAARTDHRLDVTVVATDTALNQSVEQAISVTINNVNDAPVASTEHTAQLTVGDQITLDAATLFSDEDGNALTYQSSDIPDGLTMVNGVISGTLTASGVYAFSIVANDGTIDSPAQQITLTIVEEGVDVEEDASIDTSYVIPVNTASTTDPAVTTEVAQLAEVQLEPMFSMTAIDSQMESLISSSNGTVAVEMSSTFGLSPVGTVQLELGGTIDWNVDGENSMILDDESETSQVEDEELKKKRDKDGKVIPEGGVDELTYMLQNDTRIFERQQYAAAVQSPLQRALGAIATV